MSVRSFLSTVRFEWEDKSMCVCVCVQELYSPRVGNSSVCLTGQVVQTCGELIGHFTKLTGHFIIQISTNYTIPKKKKHILHC